MWIIDRRGTIRDLSELPSLLGASFGGSKLASYAVENLGFVMVGTRPRRTFVRLRPRFVTGGTVTALWYWLHEHADRPCSVRWLADDVWRDEVIFGFGPTMRLIEALCEATVPPRHDTSNRLRRRALGGAEGAIRIDLTEMRDLVCGVPESARMRRQLSSRFGGRWTLSELDTSTGQVIVRSMGEGYPLYDCAWTCEPRGRSFDEFPDAAYGRFVTRSHREAFETARPIHDEVDAHINWPRFGVLRIRYERIIAPFFSGSRPLLLSVSAAKADDASTDL
jgi:hypothetical protein